MLPDSIADAAYLFAQTPENESSVIDAGKKIINISIARKILLLSSDRRDGYTGYLAWKGKLLNSGVPERFIDSVELDPAAPHNTLTEATAVIRFVKRNRLKSIVVTASPFHQVRAFMTAVRVALTQLPKIKIYNFPGIPLPWTEQAVHSQGTLTATRAKLIHAEMARIDKYFLKGDLISFDEVLDYLDRRDTLSEFP